MIHIVKAILDFSTSYISIKLLLNVPFTNPVVLNQTMRACTMPSSLKPGEHLEMQGGVSGCCNVWGGTNSI